MASPNVKNLNAANFRSEVLEAQQPVLVDFWAAWCGPCKMIAPVIDEIANDYAGRLVVGKLNVDENRQTAQEYGIMGIPTLLLFKGGQPVERIIGYKSKSELCQIIDRVM
ncbi:MAG: thioredoxin [Firmicutes bacterium]|nr:thioredoxin [Bacillota bacterium]